MAQNSIPRFFEKFSIKQIVILALVIFIGSSTLWWRMVYSNPERVFNSMLENSLRLKGVTRHISQSGGVQGLDQYAWVNTSGTRISGSNTILSQGEDTRVETESIGTPTGDFVRYTSIDTTQTSADGQSLDFSSILNLWGRNENLLGVNLTNGELYNESVLGVVPFGDLAQPDRAQILNTMRDQQIYEVDYTKVERELENGRPVYTYLVKIDAFKYVSMLKEFARYSGLNNLESLDPEAYKGSDKLEFKLAVDVWSRQLARIVYGAGERTEEFSAHNAQRSVAIPDQSITIDDLQQRLQDLQ